MQRLEKVIVLVFMLIMFSIISISFYSKASCKSAIPESRDSIYLEIAKTKIDNRLIVNINTAGRYSLSKLDGIGPVLAERIINYRRENGPFRDLFQITNVKGIGKVKYESIKNNIRIDG